MLMIGGKFYRWNYLKTLFYDKLENETFTWAKITFSSKIPGITKIRKKGKSSSELIKINLDEGEVASAAEKDFASDAVEFYSQEVEELIARRGRENYQTACTHMKRIKKLLLKLKQKTRWDSYVQGIREQNSKLRALKEEMDYSGLWDKVGYGGLSKAPVELINPFA